MKDSPSRYCPSPPLPAHLVVVPYVALAARHRRRRPHAAGTGWLPLSTSSLCVGPCLFIVVVIRMRVASSIMVLVTKKKENERKTHQVDTAHRRPCLPVSLSFHMWHWLPVVVVVVRVLLALAGCRC